jgi:hypothetical protein
MQSRPLTRGASGLTGDHGAAILLTARGDNLGRIENAIEEALRFLLQLKGEC